MFGELNIAWLILKKLPQICKISKSDAQLSARNFAKSSFSDVTKVRYEGLPI